MVACCRMYNVTLMCQLFSLICMVKEVRDLASSISLFNAIRFSIKIEVLESYTTPGVYILDVHK
jgi:hypothetical protein